MIMYILTLPLLLFVITSAVYIPNQNVNTTINGPISAPNNSKLKEGGEYTELTSAEYFSNELLNSDASDHLLTTEDQYQDYDDSIKPNDPYSTQKLNNTLINPSAANASHMFLPNVEINSVSDKIFETELTTDPSPQPSHRYDNEGNQNGNEFALHNISTAPSSQSLHVVNDASHVPNNNNVYEPPSSDNMTAFNSENYPNISFDTTSSEINASLKGGIFANPRHELNNKVKRDESDQFVTLNISKINQLEIPRENPSRKPGQTSLVIVFDGTGSMENCLVQLRSGAKLIIEKFAKSEANPIYNYVFVPFRDPGNCFKWLYQNDRGTYI